MTFAADIHLTAFQGARRIAGGPALEVALAAWEVARSGAPVLIFDDATGRVVDLDLSGSADAVVARYAPVEADDGRPVGRPKLGVVAREVTLLPRHWDWLATQPGGASAALRRLVDEARKAGVETDRARVARERGYRFLQAVAGDFPGYEEALRALFARDDAAFRERVAAWPTDIVDYGAKLAEIEPAPKG